MNNYVIIFSSNNVWSREFDIERVNDIEIYTSYLQAVFSEQIVNPPIIIAILMLIIKLSLVLVIRVS